MRRAAIAMLVLTSACGGDETSDGALVCDPPSRVVAGRCLAPGTRDDGCGPGTRSLGDGQCLPAGVPLEGCAEGFEQVVEAGACEPLLPAETCPDGQMAIPGESACRAVMDCGQGRWGNLPVDAATIYVDASYAGGGSDGSEARPWTTINEALSVSPPGALVAVAEGTYAEVVSLSGKAVRLWGVCPDRVQLVGDASSSSAVIFRPGSEGSEVGGMAITGSQGAVYGSGALGVVLDRVWVRDSVTYSGVEVDSSLGPMTLTIRDALIENNARMGVFVAGAGVTLERTVVRETRPDPVDSHWGRGVMAQPPCVSNVCDTQQRAELRLQRTVVEDSRELGVVVAAADLVMEGSVVRRTAPDAADGQRGRAVTVTECNPDTGCPMAARATATIRASSISESHEYGIYVYRSDAIIEGTVVRAIAADQATALSGRGIGIEGCGPLVGCDPPRLAQAQVRGSLVEQTHDYGIFVMGSEAVVEGTIVRQVAARPADGMFGRGLAVQEACFDEGCDPAAPSRLTMHGSLVEDAHDMGVAVLGSEASIDASLFRRVAAQPADGLYGDGIGVATSAGLAATAILVNVGIEEMARAGVSFFGATGDIAKVAVRCAQVPLVGQTLGDSETTIVDGGGNLCGCPVADGECRAVSPQVEPPRAAP